MRVASNESGEGRRSVEDDKGAGAVGTDKGGGAVGTPCQSEWGGALVSQSGEGRTEVEVARCLPEIQGRHVWRVEEFIAVGDVRVLPVVLNNRAD